MWFHWKPGSLNNLIWLESRVPGNEDDLGVRESRLRVRVLKSRVSGVFEGGVSQEGSWGGGRGGLSRFPDVGVSSVSFTDGVDTRSRVNVLNGGEWDSATDGHRILKVRDMGKESFYEG